MNETLGTLLVIGVFRVASLIAGCLFAYLGYRLLLSGIFAKEGDIEVVWGDARMLIKRATPGTVFALLGALILILTIYRGLDFSFWGQGAAVEPSNASLSDSMQPTSGAAASSSGGFGGKAKLAPED